MEGSINLVNFTVLRLCLCFFSATAPSSYFHTTVFTSSIYLHWGKYRFTIYKHESQYHSASILHKAVHFECVPIFSSYCSLTLHKCFIQDLCVKPIIYCKKNLDFQKKNRVRWLSGKHESEGVYWWVSGCVTSHGNEPLRRCVTSIPEESPWQRQYLGWMRKVTALPDPFRTPASFLPVHWSERQSREEVLCSVCSSDMLELQRSSQWQITRIPSH